MNKTIKNILKIIIIISIFGLAIKFSYSLGYSTGKANTIRLYQTPAIGLEDYSRSKN